jgi:alkanesulfonate monooxygenase SsuD/methylene tetrahydromethanopterin reductase-like flavin-dependent oxidoreductase (luciferase family)
MEALATYRREFKPSPHLEKPRTMVGVPVFAAETDEQAEYLATSMYQRTLGIIRGRRFALQPPVKDLDAMWTPAERFAVADRMAIMVVGGPARVREGLRHIAEATGADELILVSDAYDPRDRRRSFEIIAEAMEIKP